MRISTRKCAWSKPLAGIAYQQRTSVPWLVERSEVLCNEYNLFAVHDDERASNASAQKRKSSKTAVIYHNCRISDSTLCLVLTRMFRAYFLSHLILSAFVVQIWENFWVWEGRKHPCLMEDIIERKIAMPRNSRWLSPADFLVCSEGESQETLPGQR